MRIVEPAHLLLEALDPLLLLGEAAADVLEPILQLFMRLRDLLVHVPQILATTCHTLDLLPEPAGHFLDVTVKLTGVLLEAAVDLVGTGAARTGTRLVVGMLMPSWPSRHLRSGLVGLVGRHRVPCLRNGLMRTGMRRERESRRRPPDRRLAMRRGRTEAGLDGIELAEDHLQLMGDMGMRIWMRAWTSAETRLSTVDPDGDRTMVVHRAAGATRGSDLDPLGDTVRADLERERADRLRYARRDHRRRRKAWWAVGDRWRRRREPEMWTGHAVLRLSPTRRLEASGVRGAVVEGATPRRPRTVASGAGAFAAPFRSAVSMLSGGTFLARTPTLSLGWLLEKRHERPHRLVGATFSDCRGRDIAVGGRHRDTSEKDGSREEWNAATTDRKFHVDVSPEKWPAMNWDQKRQDVS